MVGQSDFHIQLDGVRLDGRLAWPESSKGLVIFAHGSGSSRLSTRNFEVSQALNEASFTTLLFDLLSPSEARDRSLRFDADFLGERLVKVIDWTLSQSVTHKLPIGLFGASTGAAAALVAASKRPERVRAIVSRGGRPDLAMHVLDHMRTPTLLIVGGHDYSVIEQNRRAFEKLKGAKDFSVVTRATHLFEEPGAMDEVSDLARDWFLRFLQSDSPKIRPLDRGADIGLR